MEELTNTIKINLIITLSIIEYVYVNTVKEKSFQGLVLKELKNENNNLGDRVNVIIRKFEIDLEYMKLSSEIRCFLTEIIESYKKNFFFEKYQEDLKKYIVNNSYVKKIIDDNEILKDIFDKLIQ